MPGVRFSDDLSLQCGVVASLRQLLGVWVPVLLYVAFILWLSSAPRPIPGIRYFPWMDKVVHVVEYGPLGGLLARAWRRSSPSWPWRWVQGFGFLGAALVGFIDERLQASVPGRISSPWDLVMDLLGAGLGQQWYQRRHTRRLT